MKIINTSTSAIIQLNTDKERMMATNPIDRKWTSEDYLAYDDVSDILHEFHYGRILAKPGSTANHTDIVSNVTAVISLATREAGCRVRAVQMLVKINDDTYFYPDVTVTCGESKYENDNHTMLLNPTVVIEVTSKSSETFDKGLKAELYRSLESVQAYVVIDQHRVFAQLYTRQSNGWLLQQFDKRTQAIPLHALNYDLPMSDVYLDVNV